METPGKKKQKRIECDFFFLLFDSSRRSQMISFFNIIRCLPAAPHKCGIKQLSTWTNQTHYGVPNRNECRLPNGEFRIRHHCEWCSEYFPLFLCDSKSWIESADDMPKNKSDPSSWLLMKSAVAYYLLVDASSNRCQVHGYYYARWCCCTHPFTYAIPEMRSDGHFTCGDEWKRRIASQLLQFWWL